MENNAANTGARSASERSGSDLLCYAFFSATQIAKDIAPM
ncbi:MAG: hypothetical protein ACI910_000602, partial [Oleispira sp.]